MLCALDYSNITDMTVQTTDIIAAFVLETTLLSPPSALLAAGYIPPQTKPNTEVPKMI